jgi:phenylacetaldehyde dehydrogenase
MGAGQTEAQGQAQLPPTKLFIKGEWKEPRQDGTFDSENPATEDHLATVASASRLDVDEARVAAKAALNDEWSSRSGHRRGQLLWQIADELEKWTDEFAPVDTLDNGKPILESRWVGAR